MYCTSTEGFTLAHQNVGYLTSDYTRSTDIGAKRCPWRIVAQVRTLFVSLSLLFSYRNPITKCVPWSTSVCIRRHHRISLNCAYRCQNQSRISQSWSPPFCRAGRPCSTTLQDNKIWPEKFCCCRSNFVELTLIVSSRPITNTISVLCTFENSFILQSIWNTSLAPPWQFRL